MWEFYLLCLVTASSCINYCYSSLSVNGQQRIQEETIKNPRKSFKILGEFEIEGKTYFYSKHLKNWKQAQDQCELANLEPLNLDSELEQNFFLDLVEESDLHEINGKYFIGGKKHEDNWVWSPRLSKIDQQFVWSDGKPTNENNKGCLAIFKDYQGEVGFSDVKCESKCGYFCQEIRK